MGALAVPVPARHYLITLAACTAVLPVARDLIVRADPPAGAGLALASYLALATIATLVARHGGLSWSEIAQPGSARRALIIGLAGALVLLIPLELSGQRITRFPAGDAAAWLLVAVFVEEAVFRGVLFAAFARAGGTGLALAGSTLAFTVAHAAAYPGPHLVLVLLAGTFFGLLRVVSGSLWAPAVAHLAIDLFASAA